MKTPRADMQGTGLSYGYRLSIASGQSGASVLGHSGGFPGVSASLEIYSDSGYVLAILSNQDNGAVEAGNAWRDLLVRSTAAFSD